jgi:hypothetical protein
VAAVSSPPHGESSAGSRAAPRDVDVAATFPSAQAAQRASVAAVSSPPRGESSAGSRPRPATWTSQPLSLPPRRSKGPAWRRCPHRRAGNPARGPGRAPRRGRRSHFPFRPGGARGQRGGGVLTAARGIQRGVQAAPRDVDVAATFPSAQAEQGASVAAVSSPPHRESSAGSRPRPATWTAQPLSLPPRRRHLSRFKQCPLFGLPPRRRHLSRFKQCPLLERSISYPNGLTLAVVFPTLHHPRLRISFALRFCSRCLLTRPLPVPRIPAPARTVEAPLRCAPGAGS